MAYERLDPNSLGDWVSGHADHMARYQWARELTAGKRVLDAGTGTGYGAAYLKRSGALEVVGVDIDEAAIRGARESFADMGLRFEVSNCEVLENVGSDFEIICSFENIEHLRDPHAFLAVAGHLLAPNGMLLCSTPDKDGNDQFGNPRPPNPYHVQEWNRADFRSMMLQHFEEVTMWSQVCTFACQARLQAAVSLSMFLNRRPLDRITRLTKRILGRPYSVVDVPAIASAGPADFPVVPEAVAQFVGHSACHVAVCRFPRPKK